MGAVGECAVRGGSGSAAVCGTGSHRSSRASPEASAAPGGPRAVPPGGGGPPSSMGPLRPSDGGRGGTDTVSGTGVVAGTGGVAPGGRWGRRVGRSVAAIPSAGAVRARGVVARWGRAVGSGSGGGGVGSGGGGAAGGGGVGSGGVGVAGMAHGLLVGFAVPLVGRGVGHRGQSPGLHYVVGMGEGLGAGLDGDGG